MCLEQDEFGLGPLSPRAQLCQSIPQSSVSVDYIWTPVSSCYTFSSSLSGQQSRQSSGFFLNNSGQKFRK